MKARFTSFATYKDLVGYIKCRDNGGTARACLSKGDNGIGSSGKVTAQLTNPMCALAPSVVKAKWGTMKQGLGKLVKVSLMGRECVCELADTGPEAETPICDLNPAALVKLGLDQGTELSAMGIFEWIS